MISAHFNTSKEVIETAPDKLHIAVLINWPTVLSDSRGGKLCLASQSSKAPDGHGAAEQTCSDPFHSGWKHAP